ncbi:MAG TPA: ribonuclease E/G, partial [Cellvibrio sp.]|nr:ribonuclease E/G [Cellvibrio sp.]
VSVATYLLNEKRKTISSIESRNNTRVVIVPSAELMTPHFEVQRLRDDDEGTLETSYKIVAHTDEAKTDEEDFKSKPINAPKPLVQPSSPSHPAPEPVKKPGLLSRLISSISSIFGGEKADESKGKREHRRDARRNTSGRNTRRDSRNRRDKDRKEDREIIDNLEHRSSGDIKTVREQEKREGGREEKRDNFTREPRENNEQRRPRNNRDQQRDQQPREVQTGDEEPRQQRNRNPRNERDNNRRQTTKDEPLVTTELIQTNDEIQGEGDDRPSKRPAGRRTRSQQRRRTRRDEFESAESGATDSLADKEEVSVSEPKVLSESAQLAQQISAAIVEHAQQAQGSKGALGIDSTNAKAEANSVEYAAPTPSLEPEEPKTNEDGRLGLAETAGPVFHTKPEPASTVEAESQASVAVTALDLDEVEIEKVERKTVTEVSIGSPTRASNDPRKAPKPISQVTIITETIENQVSRALDTSLPPTVDHNPRPLTRPSNDPRLSKRNTTE